MLATPVQIRTDPLTIRFGTYIYPPGESLPRGSGPSGEPFELKNAANEASDLASTYAVALERVVVYASVPVALAKLGADYVSGGFNGS